MTINLKEAREAAGYTLEHIANKLNIRKQYLLALEEENYDLIPGKIYVEGYKKMYYEFLGINVSTKQTNIQLASIANSTNTIEMDSKYKKYIIFCSVVLFILVVAAYNFLRNAEAEIDNQDVEDTEEQVTQTDTINGNNKEILSGSDQTN